MLSRRRGGALMLSPPGGPQLAVGYLRKGDVLIPPISKKTARRERRRAAAGEGGWWLQGNHQLSYRNSRQTLVRILIFEAKFGPLMKDKSGAQCLPSELP